MPRAYITGLDGEALSREERDLLREAPPAGIILFNRNCGSREQIKALVGAAHEAAGHGRLLVLIDQEGGRVQRLRPPLAPLLPAAASFEAAHPGRLGDAARAANLVARSCADTLKAFGVNTCCAPVLDVPVTGAHQIIGNRAYSHDPGAVATLGRAVADGLLAGGVLPVMKHIPGHGRAGADSHLELPVVATGRAELERSDLAPFAALRGLPAAMTAHVVFASIDPDRPASTSPVVTRDVIRGAIGFDGLLMSDDLGMRALSGTFGERTRAVLAAGSDLALHCSGAIEEMREVAAAAPFLAGRSLERFLSAHAATEREAEPFDVGEAEAIRQSLVARVA